MKTTNFGVTVMPIIKGGGKKTQKKNIKEIMDSYESKGKIGNSKPKSKKKAIAQAVAISYKAKRGK